MLHASPPEITSCLKASTRTAVTCTSRGGVREEKEGKSERESRGGVGEENEGKSERENRGGVREGKEGKK